MPRACSSPLLARRGVQALERCAGINSEGFREREPGAEVRVWRPNKNEALTRGDGGRERFDLGGAFSATPWQGLDRFFGRFPAFRCPSRRAVILRASGAVELSQKAFEVPLLSGFLSDTGRIFWFGCGRAARGSLR